MTKHNNTDAAAGGVAAAASIKPDVQTTGGLHWS